MNNIKIPLSTINKIKAPPHLTQVRIDLLLLEKCETTEYYLHLKVLNQPNYYIE